jgi:membrane protein
MASNRFSRLAKIFSGADSDEIFFQPANRLERFAHFWTLVAQQFVRHRCLVRASALSFSSLLALIPCLAVAVSVTGLIRSSDEKHFSQLIEHLVASIAPNTLAADDYENYAGGGMVINSATGDTQKKIAEQIQQLVKNTNSSALGVTGLIVFIFTVVSLLRGIEETFNDIWGVTRGRTFWMQVLLYWTIPTLGAILLVTALGLANGSRFQHTRDLLDATPHFSFVSAHLLPILILSLALAMFYKLTPNTKVETRAAMVGGFFAGTTWHLYNQLGFLVVSKTVGGIYGSLALLVLLMGGLYIVWLILLFGAQMAYAYQNRAAYLQDRLADNVNQRGREFVALRIMMCLGQRFQNALRPATVPQLSGELEIPSRLTQSVLRTLAHARLVTEIAGTDAAFVPARPLPDISAHDILMAMRTANGRELPQQTQPELAEIYGEFARIEEAERAAAEKISLLALVKRAPAAAALPEPEVVMPEEKLPAFEDKVLEGKFSAPEPEPEPEQNPATEIHFHPAKVETKVPEKKAAHREVVQPDETDFPL